MLYPNAIFKLLTKLLSLREGYENFKKNIKNVKK